MGFSFADLGFWRLATVAFVLELLHLILGSHWPGLQNSLPGPRPPAAKLYMLIEALALGAALSAAIGLVGRMSQAVPRPNRQIALVALAALGLVGMLLFVWQR